MSEIKKVRNEFLMFVGLIVIVFLVGGGILYGLYAVIGELTPAGIHLLATAEAVAIPIAFAIGLQVARAHRAGVQAGLDLRIDAKTRTAEASRKPAPEPKQTPAERFNSRLPQPSRAIISPRTAESSSQVDL